jgi:hypothetical protein
MQSVEAVRRTRASDNRREFRRRVAMQAASLRTALDAGEFGGEFRVGLELEGYAVDADGHLARIPDAVFAAGCERELGRHNAEVNTPATGFDQAGLARQARSLRDRVAAVRDALGDADRRFVTDGVWTTGPPEGTLAYLTDVRERAGVDVPANLAPSHRYYALDADVTASGPVHLDLPGCRRAFSSILVESLATSMQVHLQTPTEAFPEYFNAALRTTGPVLALAANAPFLPPALYTDPEPETVLTAGVELRVPVFESLNVTEPGKVRFPTDLDRPADVVDRILADRLCAPYLREWVADGPRDGFGDAYWELLHKQGTCWRWVRPVLGPGGPRIEYRVLAAQPSVADVVAFQSLVAGLLHGIVSTDHPLTDLPWQAAEDSFYAATRAGLDADLAWVTREGTQTHDPERVYPELFDLARVGLRDQGVPAERVDRVLAPVERRWERRLTPSVWKRRQVRERLDAGADLESALREMQATYVERSSANRPFVDW